MTIKHSTMKPGEQPLLMSWLEESGTSIGTTETSTSIIIDHEEKIAEIVRAFHRCKVDVLRGEVDEPKLKDISLES